MQKFDIVELTETRMEAKAWKKMSNKESKKYNWFCILAIKKKHEMKNKWRNCGSDK